MWRTRSHNFTIYNLQFTVSMLTPGRIIDSESRLVTTLTLIARQRADTGTPRYQGIMAGWREKWISIVYIISIATIPTWLLYHYRSCTHRHEECPHTRPWAGLWRCHSADSNTGLGERSELLMSQWVIIFSIYTPATSNKVASNMLSTATCKNYYHDINIYNTSTSE